MLPIDHYAYLWDEISLCCACGGNHTHLSMERSFENFYIKIFWFASEEMVSRSAARAFVTSYKADIEGLSEASPEECSNEAK